MTDLTDYATETEAARMVGVSAGKGVVWRHLREHAPHIKQENIFGITAVRRDKLEAWCGNGRKKVVDAFTRQKRRAMLRRLHQKVQARQ